MILKGKPMAKDPLISIITVGHNEEETISKEIDSILNQSYKNFEMILIDNCSKDRTYDIMKGYQKKYPEKIRIFKRNGVQNGPGVAWNLGAKKANGDILLTFGGDVIFGKDYVKRGIQPIISGKTIGVLHHEEKIINLENLWARAFCKKRLCTKRGKGKIFSLIRKDAFEKYGPFDISLGYGDDQTINKKHSIESLSVDLEIYHKNPDTFNQTWKHDIWIGHSFQKPFIVLLSLPMFPLWVMFKTLKHLKRDFIIEFIFFLPIFYILRYIGYYTGAIKKISRMAIK